MKREDNQASSVTKISLALQEEGRNHHGGCQKWKDLKTSFCLWSQFVNIDGFPMPPMDGNRAGNRISPKREYVELLDPFRKLFLPFDRICLPFVSLCWDDGLFLSLFFCCRRVSTGQQHFMAIVKLSHTSYAYLNHMQLQVKSCLFSRMRVVPALALFQIFAALAHLSGFYVVVVINKIYFSSEEGLRVFYKWRQHQNLTKILSQLLVVVDA